ncbi:MAG: amino acid adenylation domain-containing protein, partial [bacterium]|nr:amino acid adenylation domain-containing protein [bacterium]
IEIPGLTLKPYNYDEIISRFDLSLQCIEIEEKLDCSFEYSTNLFESTTIERFIKYFEKIIDNITREPGIKISGIEIVSEEEKKQLLFDFNAAVCDYPKEKSIQQLFEEQVDKTPGNIAAVFGERHLSYRMLNRLSNRSASRLREKGAAADMIIGIMVKRSLEMLVGVMAILKAGGAYLPIDPDYPRERIDFMLKDSGAKILVSEASEDEGIESVLIDPVMRELTVPPAQLTHLTHPTHLSYIIYTSGTTGRPKGVMVEHRNVVAYIYAHLNEFPLRPGDIVILEASFVFDAFVEEFYPPLVRGAKICMARKDEVMDAHLLETFIVKNNITQISCSPLLLNELNRLENLDNLRTVHTFISGADVLNREYISRLRGRARLGNVYGPTETTVAATCYKLPEEVEADIPIGKPFANYQVYILDKNGKLQGIGLSGEICIAGDGVGRGYLNQPELTAAKFPPAGEPSHPPAGGPSYPTHSLTHSPLYRTGDLGRRLPDGNIQFQGRLDHQVKIRGFRIELGEIESQLLKYDGVNEAVVVTHTDETGDKRLCAYFTPGKEINLPELREFLAAALADYMIPGYFVPLEHIPLTPTGKVDRKALPEPGTGIRPDKYSPPQGDTEEKLVRIWHEVLGTAKEKIGRNANFFTLGGHSLRATVMLARIHKELNVEFPLAQVFKTPTIKGLSDYIKGLIPSQYISLEPSEEKEYYDLSHAQERVWALSQLEEASIAFNIPMVQILEGELNLPAFDRTFKALSDRHESFRTAFFTIDGKPKQKILPPEDVVFQVNRFHLEGDPEQETKIREQVKQESAVPFDLTEAPLLRVFISRLEEKKHIFFLNMHHIISDFLSFDVFIGELLILYGAFLREETDPLEPLRIQYKDYARWHNEQIEEERFNLHREYWLNRLTGKLPRLELHPDKERPAVQTYNGAEVGFVFDEVFFEKLKTFSETHNVTLFMTLLTALNLLFYHYTGQTDIILGTVIAGREHADLQGQVGYYLNTLALRSRFDGMDTFTAVLNNVKTVLTEAYQHQAYPFDLLVRDLGGSPDRSRHPVFDVVADMLNYNADHEETLEQSGSGNIRFKDYDFQAPTTKFDLTVYFIEGEKSMDIRFSYNIDLFEAATIERMMNRFRKLLDSILAEPDAVVSGLRLEEKARAPKIQRISRRREGQG